MLGPSYGNYANRENLDANLATIAAVLFGLAGCSKKETPVVILASSEDGRSQFDHAGPGMYSYNQNFGSFTFKIGPVSGQPWITGSGEMTLGDSNDVVIAIQSEGDQTFDMRVLGVFTNNNMNASENQTDETFRVAAGKQALKVDCFIIYTYDFHRR